MEFAAIAEQLHTAPGGFYEQGVQDRLRAQRPDSTSDPAGWLQTTYDLINRQLQDGETEAALNELNALFDVLEQSPEYLEREPNFHLLQALVHLRRAEVENCVKRHNAECCLFPLAGGGLRMGQVIGKSSAKLEVPTERPIHPQDLMATIFHMYGLSPKLQFTSPQGRPTYMVENGRPIKELI